MTAVAVLLGVAAPAAHAGTLKVVVQHLPCPTSDRISVDVERRAAAFMPEQPDLVLLVEGDPAGNVVLRLVGTAAKFQSQVLVAPGDCGALSSSIAVLLQSWLTSSLLDSVSPARIDSTTSPAPTRSEPAPESPRIRRGQVEHGSVALTVLGGVYDASGTGGAGPSLEATLESRLEDRWGLWLTLGYDGPRSAPGLISGQLAVDSWRLGGALRHTVRLGASAALDLALGPTLCLIALHPSGFVTSNSKVVPDLEWTAAVRARLRVLDRVWAIASAEAGLRTRSETLLVDETEAMSLGRARLAMRAGVAWEPF